jgi:hypothetical protein
MTNETLKEYAKKRADEVFDIDIDELRQLVIDGAKWQADKSYTKEEVIAFAKWMYDYKADINKLEECLEQFKK